MDELGVAPILGDPLLGQRFKFSILHDSVQYIHARIYA